MADTQSTNPTSNLSLWESLAQISGKLINDETAVGKSGKAAIWSFTGLVVVAVLTAITTPAGSAYLIALHWGSFVTIANVLLVLLKNIFDKEVPNI